MTQARIASINDLTDLGNGRYKHNMTRSRSNANIRVHSDDISPTWDCSFKFKLSTNWTWGKRKYDPATNKADFLTNLKIFRLWNPGNTHENCYVGIMGWEPNMHFTIEHMGKQNWRFMPDYKQRITLGVDHIFRFEFKENSELGLSDGWMRISFDDEIVFERDTLITRETEEGFKRPLILGFDDVWAPSVYDDHAPNDIEIWDIKREMETPVMPPPTPPPEPPIDPPIDPPVEPSLPWPVHRDDLLLEQVTRIADSLEKIAGVLK